MSTERLGTILLRNNLIDENKLNFCLSIQRRDRHEPLGKVLRHYNFISEDQLMLALSQQAGWEVYQGGFELDQQAAEILGLDFLCEHALFPAKEALRTVFVLSRTDNMSAVDAVQVGFPGQAQFAIAPEWRLRQALNNIQARGAQLKCREEDDLVASFEEYLNLAVAKGASDIHIEPSAKAIELRFRIDGMLHFIAPLSLTHLSRLVNIIFHRADVTISDFGHFHDARFNHSYLDRAIDVRVSHIPGIHGSSVVLRLLDKSRTSLSLSRLGFSSDSCQRIRDILIKPDGLTLIIGPTGCGKTTTLYAMINELKSISRKIVTVEDPVEMPLPLVTQVQIHEKRGVDFASCVRAFLRHDPNIMMIGEIRDEETAKQAIRACMTGHKVFASVHASHPMDAIFRLNDLGVSCEHLAGQLSAIICQRLLRTLCASCKRQEYASHYREHLLSHKYIDDPYERVSLAQGCDKCQGGYDGRTAISEVLMIDEAFGNILAGADFAQLRLNLASHANHESLLGSAKRLVKQGCTSIDECVRVLG